MAQPSWAPKRKKGESESSYKKRYYTAQRQDAEKRGRAGSDTAQAEVRKIYGKLGRQAPQDASGGGTDRVDRAALGIGTMLADPLVGVARGLIRRGATAAAETGVKALARRAEGQAAKKGTSIVAKAAERAKPRASAAKVERPALPRPKSSVPATRAKSVPAQRSTALAKRAPVKSPSRVSVTPVPPVNSKKKASKKK